ncbi:MAG: hypothetical protein JNK72_10165 [Myxococcales bacterium]|nr:hypothetical protein [Myxococcales bacterium]
MPEAGRKGDLGHCPADSHGCPACPHDVKGPATDGSENVLINAERALRVGDPGVHSSCCGPNQWQATGGAPGVFINGKKAHRKGDAQAHCGGDGQLSTGSGNVIIGDKAGGGATAMPHDKSIDIEYTDALGRPIQEITVRAVCQHKKYPEVTFNHTVTLSGLCEDAAVLVLKGLEHFEDDRTDDDDDAVA